MSLIAAAGTSQVPRLAYASASGVSDRDSCLALPAKAMAKWDEQGRRCAVQGTLEIRAGDILDVAPGVTLAVEQKGRLENRGGTISVSPGAALMVGGRLENAAGATLANSGNVTVAGALVNEGIIASSADGMLKNAGRISNRGGMIINGAGSTLLNEARMASSSGGTINSMGTVDNRGIMSMMHGSVLAGGGAAAGARAGSVENAGRLVLYCNSFVTAAVSGNQPVDRCDNPPSASIYAFVPAQGGDNAFTFYANATDDRRVTQLEWDFDGDGVPDYLQQVQPPSKSADMWVSHRYEREGVYRPQVRAVDSAGAASPWHAYGEQGKELDVVIPAAAAAAGTDGLLQLQQEQEQQKQNQQQVQEKEKPAAANNTSLVGPHSAPVASGLEVAGKQGLPVQILLNATDADGDRLAFYVTSKPAHGSLTGQAPELTYIPVEEYVGKDSFTFVASDGTLQSKPAKVSITITPQSTIPANQTTVVTPPADPGPANGNDEKKAEKEADVDEDKIGSNSNNNNNSNVPGSPGQQQPGTSTGSDAAPVAEGQTVATSQGTPAEIWLSASDADGDTLHFQVTSQPTHGRLSGSAPVLTYTPDAGYQGQDSFVFSAANGSGKSSTATVTITVNSGSNETGNNNLLQPTPGNNINLPPMVANDDVATTQQDAQVLISVLSNDYNSAGAQVKSVTSPENGSAVVTGGGTGVIYTPNPGFAGTDAFTYTAAAAANGSSDGGGGTSASAVVRVTVMAKAATENPANPQPPAASPPAQQQEPKPPAQVRPQPAVNATATATLYCGRQASSFASIVNGTEGNDDLVGTEGDDLILGQGANDTLNGMGGNDCIMGGDGNDSIWGGSGDDEIHGGAGDDKVIGDGGADLLYGEDGSDSIWGGDGDDRLYGGAAGDSLVGDAGNDRLYGEAGNDTIYDDQGDDSIDGGDGSGDRCWDGAGVARMANCEGQ